MDSLPARGKPTENSRGLQEERLYLDSRRGRGGREEGEEGRREREGVPVQLQHC